MACSVSSNMMEKSKHFRKLPGSLVQWVMKSEGKSERYCIFVACDNSEPINIFNKNIELYWKLIFPHPYCFIHANFYYSTKKKWYAKWYILVHLTKGKKEENVLME